MQRPEHEHFGRSTENIEEPESGPEILKKLG
jgi:hypothetical protein